jgi:5-methylcytosine-specific restriction endonuclease McrA
MLNSSHPCRKCLIVTKQQLAYLYSKVRAEQNRLYRRRYDSKWKYRYKMMRAFLVRVMGGHCCICGTTNNLQFDHPWGSTWMIRDQNARNRALRYFADWRNGNLRLLCRWCNRKDGVHRRDNFGAPLYDPNVLVYVDTEETS